MTILFYFSLDYFIKYIICIYFEKNKNMTISHKFPKILYNYLSELKAIS